MKGMDGIRYFYSKLLPMTGKQNVWKVKANGFEFELDEAALKAADLIRLSPDAYHLIHDHRPVQVRITGSDSTGKSVDLELDGEPYGVEIKDPLDQMLDKMGYASASGKHLRDVRAPMPGLVLDVFVKAGQEVNEGDRLLILSAMKMENSIVIHAGAKIKKVNVQAGQAVEKGQVLVELE